MIFNINLMITDWCSIIFYFRLNMAYSVKSSTLFQGKNNLLMFDENYSNIFIYFYSLVLCTIIKHWLSI